MKLFNNTLFILFCFIVGCSSWKGKLISKGDLNQTIENSITDFLLSSSQSKKDSLFSIYIEDGSDYNDYEINDGVFVFSISASTNKLLPTIENKVGTNHPYFPTRYIEKNNKLFYWYDPNSLI